MPEAVKMVLVMRTKFPDGKGGTLSPRKGKMIAQGAHAASAFLIERLERHEGPARLCTSQPFTVLERAWLQTGATKICVRVDDEEQLDAVHEKALAAGLPVHLIVDLGRTEFPEPMKTCLAIGPAMASEIDKVTGDLSLL